LKLDDRTVYAGFWRRLAAFALDSVLFGLFMSVILSAATGQPGLRWFSAESWPAIAYDWEGPALFQGLPFVLTVAFWVGWGATPGKLLMGCQVLDARTGTRPGVGQAVVRYLGYIVSALPLLLGFAWIAWDRRKQGFHDKLARTVVVVEDASRHTLEELAGGTP